MQTRKNSQRIHNPLVQNRIKAVTNELAQRNTDYAACAKQQKSTLQLPLLPITTLGSFPQTSDIRKIRQEYKSGKITHEIYQQRIKQQIADVIAQQEALDLDVLVHGEAERNDMFEYFGELINMDLLLPKTAGYKVMDLAVSNPLLFMVTSVVYKQ